MARKQITSRSSPGEIKIANDQLRAAENEYRDIVNSWPTASDYGLSTAGSNNYHVNPTNNSPMTASNWEAVKANIATKYDYVDFGIAQPITQPGQPTEINIGSSQFFVKGLGSDTKTTYEPGTNQTVSTDDAYRAPTSVQSKINQPGNNPNAAKINQDTAINNTSSNQTAIQSSGVTSNSQASSNTTQKELSQAEKSVSVQEQTQAANTGTGVVETNPNSVATTPAAGQHPNNQIATSPGQFIGQSDDTARIPNGKIGQNGSTANADGVSNSVETAPDPGRTGDGGTTIGTKQAILVAPQSSGTPNNPKVEVRPNILHNYVNWTYKIGLYMLGTDEYNSIVQTGKVSAEAKQHPIAVSGGYKRSAAAGNLAGDYYIDDLRFTSIIGNRSAGAGTNSVDLEMTIVEPYGARLLGELLILSGGIFKDDISLAEIPYLLEIDFTGYKDDGTPIPTILGDNGKKYIPVKIISMDMKLESAGARYTFQMAPYSFYALTSRYGVIPKAVTILGTTLKEVLGEENSGLVSKLNKLSQELVTKDGHQKYADVYNIKFYSFSKDGTVNSELENAKVAFPTTGGYATDQKNRPTAAMGAAMGSFSPTQAQSYSIEQNSVIIKAIRDIVYASEYFPQKMKPEAPNEQKDQAAELIKIIPQIEIDTTKWDDARNEYAKKITYHVFNTLLWGENFAWGGTAPIGQWGYSKIYNYLFTGKNDDIIDCDVNFNLVYYTKITPDRKETGIIRNDINANFTLARAKSEANRIANPSVKSTTTEKNAPADNFRYVNATIAANFADLKMNNSNGDMITMDLNIIGDPEWISQDSSIRGGEFNIADFTTKLDKHGSIAVDVAGVYVKLQLKSPRDYNDATGTMDVNDDQSMVGGVYQVITVENNFSGGKFTSTLKMVKIPNQEENAKPSTSATGPGGIFG